MCTAIGCNFESFYFGRTLDLDCSYGENVVLTPRNFPLSFRDAGLSARHYAILGMATVKDNFPLYYDAVNEKGLCMAGLRFADNAYYQPLPENVMKVRQRVVDEMYALVNVQWKTKQDMPHTCHCTGGVCSGVYSHL